MGTLTERGRVWIKTVMEPPARVLVRLNVSPDVVTLVGTLGTSVVALWLIPQGLFWQALALAIVFAFADSLDGTMARLAGRSSSFGAFLDSTMDRITDAVAFVAVAWYYVDQGDNGWAGVTMVALVGGFLVSYARARAEGLGMKADVGVAERTERLVILGLGLLFAGLWLPALAVAVSLVAALSWITVVQRMWFVRTQSMASR
jgi:CDP-diacylglycerol---glycerol-3-phosphate 3-phosphatidyltransferase